MNKSKRDTLESAGSAGETPIAWRNTIFCESDDGHLKAALNHCAAELGCRVWYNEDTAPDILAVGSFIHIVERRLLGEETWRYYVRCCDGSNDAVPCILVDNLAGLPLPKTKQILRLDIACPDAFARLTGIIRDLKKRMDKKIPIAHRKRPLPCIQRQVRQEDGSVLTKFDWE